MQSPISKLKRIISHLPEGDHQFQVHDLGLVMNELAGFDPTQLNALLTLAKGHSALSAAIETELGSREKKGEKT